MPQNARQKRGLRGPVSVVRTIIPAREGQSVFVSRYGEDGNLLEEFVRYLDGRTVKASYRYDNARVIECKQEENGQLVKRFLTEYKPDSTWENATTEIDERTGGRRTVGYSGFGADGAKVKVQFVPSRQGLYGFSAEDSPRPEYVIRGVSRITTVYSDSQQARVIQFHDGEERLLSAVTLEFDGRGYLVREQQDEGATVSMTVHRWSNNGNPVLTRVDDCDSRQRSYIQRRYNELGDVVLEVHREVGRGVFTSMRKRYQYEYDDDGNWTTRATMVSAKDQPEAWSMETRELAYS